jgi:hypothetical protein
MNLEPGQVIGKILNFAAPKVVSIAQRQEIVIAALEVLGLFFLNPTTLCSQSKTFALTGC